MKVLLVNGSARKNGNTFTALTEIANTLQAEGIETEIFQIGNKPLRGCIACGTCQTKQNGRCVFDDDICNQILERAEKADAFVFGSPVYYGQPNGALMAIIQRMLWADGSAFAFKPVANVAIARRGGATSSYQSLNMLFEMNNMPIITSQYWNLAYGMNPDEVKQDTEGMQTMRQIGRNMAWMLKKFKGEKTTELPETEAWAPMHFIR